MTATSPESKPSATAALLPGNEDTAGNCMGDDAFKSLFLARVGPAMAASFDAGQLAAIKSAFGSRMIGTHAVDIRQSIKLFGHAFYFVVLAGPEQRSDERRNERARHIGRLLLAAFCELLALAAVAGGLVIILSGHK